MVASAAPAVAASPGFLSFTGKACKLPGNSSSILKGYVFELRADNKTGPLPDDAVTVIDTVTVNGVSTDFKVAVRTESGGDGSCTCGSCGSNPDHEFCTPDGAMQQVLIYTAAEPTGTSENANMCITYTVYDCKETTVCGSGTSPAPQPLCSGAVSTPTAQDTPGGGSCLVENVFQIP